jgi:hypothetical protein
VLQINYWARPNRGDFTPQAHHVICCKYIFPAIQRINIPGIQKNILPSSLGFINFQVYLTELSLPVASNNRTVVTNILEIL